MNKSIGLNNNRVLSSNHTSSKSHHSLFHLLSQSQRPWDFWDVSLLFLLVFGLVGNLLSIIVMSRKRMRNTNASLFVTSMAISDCLFLSIKFLSNVIKVHRLPIYSACIVIQNVLPHTTLFVSVWLIIITSLERAIAVLYPFRVAILFSHTRCKCLIAAICIFFFALSNSTTPCLEYNLDKPYYCQIKGFQNGTCFFYYSYVFPWIKAALGAWIPSVLGILLNVLIARGLFAASRARQSIVSESVPLRQVRSSITTNSLQISHSAQKLACPNNVLKTNYSSADVVNLINSSRRASSQNMSPQNNQYQVQQQQQGGQQSSHLNHHKEKQITIMLMTISISFMVLSFPYSAFELLRRLNVNLPILKDRDTSRFLLLLLDINHATNFILYCLTGQKFRSELKALLMQWLRPGRYQDEYKQQISQMSSINGNIQIRRVNDDKTQTFN